MKKGARANGLTITSRVTKALKFMVWSLVRRWVPGWRRPETCPNPHVQHFVAMLAVHLPYRCAPSPPPGRRLMGGSLARCCASSAYRQGNTGGHLMLSLVPANLSWRCGRKFCTIRHGPARGVRQPLAAQRAKHRVLGGLRVQVGTAAGQTAGQTSTISCSLGVTCPQSRAAGLPGCRLPNK